MAVWGDVCKRKDVSEDFTGDVFVQERDMFGGVWNGRGSQCIHEGEVLGSQAVLV